MSSVNQEWKGLRPQIGALISHIDSLYAGAENIDEALARAKSKGYNNGFKDGKDKQLCKSCNEKRFYMMCYGYRELFSKFIDLDINAKMIIKETIEQLYKVEQLKNRRDSFMEEI